MKVYGVTEAELQQVMRIANKAYKGNLEFVYTEPHRNHVQFTMRVKDSHGKGARTGMTGRRMVAACWHAHRDFMRVLFERHPAARLVSAQAVYNGKDGFERNFQATGDKNIGSMMQPLFYRYACDCGGF